MKKKLIALATALGLSFALLTGCSKPTVESLVDGMFDGEIDSQTAEMDMDMTLTLGIQGLSMDVTVSGSFDVQSSGLTGDGEQMNYMGGDLKLDLMGESESAGFEMYAVMEDDMLTSYIYNEDADAWYKSEVEAGDSGSLDQDTMDAVNEAMKDVLKENGELAEDTEEIGGEECYVLTATIAGDDFVTILEPLRGILDEAMEEADMDIDMLSWFSYLSMDVTYYISKDTGYEVSCEIDMAATDLYGMVEQIIKDAGADELGVMDAIEEIAFAECKFSAVMSDINETEVKIPDDVIDNAVEMDEAGVIDDIMGGVGATPDVPEELPVVPEEPDADVTGEDEWFHGDSFTFNKCDAYNEFLCEVKIPDGYTYDSTFSDPEAGLVCLDRADGNGYIWVQNEVESPMYYSLLNDGVLPVDEYPELAGYENYQFLMETVGTAFGGSDVIVAVQTYTYDGMEIGDAYICIQYDDNGYKEFLAVDLGSVYDLDSWTDQDFLDLAVSLFGR